MTANEERLAQIRLELDAIDVELHAFLMRRAMLAPEVIHAKGGLGPFWRPAREAQILRRRIAAHEGHFPPAAIAKIWCEIICGMISMETRFRLTLWSPPGDDRLVQLARDYFGQVVPVSRVPSAQAALFAAGSDHDVAAVLPWPGTPGVEPWWIALAEHRTPALSIVWRLPFIKLDDGRPAAVVSRVAMEKTEDDRSLVAVQVEGDPAIPGAEIARHEDWRLIELDGFLPAGEAGLAALQTSSVLRAVQIGAYAVPIALDPAHPTELRKHPK
jgi:chorismate mutase/prephenate dehydratase